MQQYKVKDMNLAGAGAKKIKWAQMHMPVLSQIADDLAKTKPLKNFTVGVCIHVTKETAVLVKTLKTAGATVALCGCNPLSTQDDVAAALAKEGFPVFAWRGQTNNEYYSCIDKVLDFKPHITIDDGGDLISAIHTKRKDLLKHIIGGCEETTMGVNRLRLMEKDNALKYPVMAVNDAYTKYLFDNRYGTGQSSLDGILRATNILFAGKTVVVVGYGWCGKGTAMRAKGMGSHVIVCEIDPIRALEAVMDGFMVMPISQAAKMGDIFITVTGNASVISLQHIKSMKTGAILANAGHFNKEIDVESLEKESVKKEEIRPNTVEYTLKNKKRVYLLGEGRLVNLVAAEGHPSEVMDMSFATQALSVLYISKNYKQMQAKVYTTLLSQDQKIATLKLQSMGVKIDQLTATQKKYLSSWKEGT